MKTGTRILVVEDDRAISRLLQLELEYRGHVVQCIADGQEALDAVEASRPDIVILDILLPGLDGERVLHVLRSKVRSLPIIMLTARDAASSKIRNLDGGADDYLTKPFDIDELVARLGSVLRRSQGDELLRVGDLVVNQATREVHRGSRRIELSFREYELLEYLALHARQVMTRATILDRVWHDTRGSGRELNLVDVYIGYLRKKIESSEESRLIHTVRGVGFSLREA